MLLPKDLLKDLEKDSSRLTEMLKFALSGANNFVGNSFDITRLRQMQNQRNLQFTQSNNSLGSLFGSSIFGGK